MQDSRCRQLRSLLQMWFNGSFCKRMQTGVGKWTEVASVGHCVARVNSSQHVCKFCGIREGTSSFKQCSNCKAVRYCSGRCQQQHWRQHKTLCQAISSLEERKCREGRENAGVFVSHLSPQEHAPVVRLVKRKCIVKCLLNELD